MAALHILLAVVNGQNAWHAMRQIRGSAAKRNADKLFHSLIQPHDLNIIHGRLWVVRSMNHYGVVAMGLPWNGESRMPVYVFRDHGLQCRYACSFFPYLGTEMDLRSIPMGDYCAALYLHFTTDTYFFDKYALIRDEVVIGGGRIVRDASQLFFRKDGSCKSIKSN